MMRLTCILIALAVVGTYADEPEKIVGGMPAFIEQYPSAVSMRMRNNHMCGGSIIGPRHILTAAHCIAPLLSNPSMLNDVTVVTGTTYLNKGGEVFRVEKMIMHESYVPSNMGRTAGFDIGILKLNRPIQFNARQQPLNLPTSDVRSGEPVTLAAWGNRGFRQPTHNELQKLNMNAMLWNVCQQYHQQTSMRVDPREFCALISMGTGTCNGDSGSGVMREGDKSIIGLVSGGIPCARGLPDIYTNVYPFVTWIRQTMTR